MEIRDKIQMMHMASENILNSIAAINNDEGPKTKNIMEMLMVLGSCSELVSHATESAVMLKQKRESHELLNSNNERLIDLHNMLHQIHDPMSEGGYKITIPEFDKFRDMVLLVIAQLTQLISLEDPRPDVAALHKLHAYHINKVEEIATEIKLKMKVA